MVQLKSMETRTELINYLIKKNNYKSYLEIGIQFGTNFFAVALGDKDGVDPDCYTPTDIHLKSDDFFKQNHKTYDLIFIDGLHLREQVERDIYHSLKILNQRGLILVHDCNPLEKKHQLRKMKQLVWNGDVWKAIAKIRMTDPDLSVSVVDLDHGIGVIKPGQQQLFRPQNNFLTWNFLQANKKKLLNLVSVDEFLNSLEVEDNN